MKSVPTVTRVACYARVSTEDQADRQTIDAQKKFLRRYCDLHGLEIAGWYADDGISGTVPLEDRPDGRRLLEGAEAGGFDVVLVYRLDRLGRSLKSLLAAHDWLDNADVAIRSGTEPFDTTSPIGKFLFSLLASMAELENKTISERMSRGRDRVAAQGQYTGGPLPFGYDLDDEKRYIPSARIVDQLGMTEAEAVREIFRRIAFEGGSLNGEATRLTSLGVPRTYRYAVHGKRGDQRIKEPAAWTPSAIYRIVHNTIYKGAKVLHSRYGEVDRTAPALVDADTWERAQAAVTKNRKLSKKNAKREYPLRGLLRCGLCGLNFSGGTNYLGRRHYRCTSLSNKVAKRPEPCAAGILNADRLEHDVWQEVRTFIKNPGPYIEQAQQQLRQQMTDVSVNEAERKRLMRDLAGKEQERERVLDLFRRGRITTAECDRDLDKVASEARDNREMLDAIRARADMVAASESYLADVGATLVQIHGNLDAIEAANDWQKKRELIEAFVRRMVVQTEIVGVTPGGRRLKEARVDLTMAYDRVRVVSGRESRPL
jgi:site-specific DNA recombinase